MRSLIPRPIRAEGAAAGDAPGSPLSYRIADYYLVVLANFPQR